MLMWGSSYLPKFTPHSLRDEYLFQGGRLFCNYLSAELRHGGDGEVLFSIADDGPLPPRAADPQGPINLWRGALDHFESQGESPVLLLYVIQLPLHDNPPMKHHR